MLSKAKLRLRLSRYLPDVVIAIFTRFCHRHIYRMLSSWDYSNIYQMLLSWDYRNIYRMLSSRYLPDVVIAVFTRCCHRNIYQMLSSFLKQGSKIRNYENVFFVEVNLPKMRKTIKKIYFLSSLWGSETQSLAKAIVRNYLLDHQDLSEIHQHYRSWF